MTRDLDLPGIGKVQLKKIKRSRRVSISVKPDMRVTVSIPYYCPFHEGERFLFSKREWIEKQFKKFKINHFANNVFYQNKTRFTRTRDLILKPDHLITENQVNLTEEAIIIKYPQHIDIKSEHQQQIIRRGLIEAMRIEALNYLPKQLANLAKKYDFHYRSVSVRYASTRWGSCSHNNTINLNLQLIRLPDELSDLIMIHELVHTKHKNHSTTFWCKFEQLIENAREKSAEIKKYGLLRI